MDYCYACRRHLNGAFSCPGCGTPADRLTLPRVTETARLPVVTEDGEGPAPSGGRAADRGRRRGRARGRQQRAAVYGVGLVAVAGALTMFSMAALSGGGSGDTTPEAPGVTEITHPAGGGHRSPGAPGATTTAPARSGGPASGPATSAPPSTTATRRAPATPATRPATRRPTATATTPRGSTPPTSAPPTATAAPTRPAPTQTPCKPVLWWCQ